MLMAIIRQGETVELLEDAKPIFSTYAEEEWQTNPHLLCSHTVEHHHYLLTRYVFPTRGNRQLNGIKSKAIAVLPKQGISGAIVQLKGLWLN